MAFHTQGDAGTKDAELRLTIPNVLRELDRVNARATALLEQHAVAASTIYATQLALEELISNVIRHGYDDDRPHDIVLSIRVRESGVELELVDDGREFDPVTAPEVALDVPLAERRVGGLGVHLVRKFVREIRYERRENRNHLWLRV